MASLSDVALLEFLAKVIAYRALKKGMELPHFLVKDVFDLAPGFPTFVLKGKEGIVVLFRGTDLRWKGKASIWADLDLKGPGLSLYFKRRHQLTPWLKQPQSVAVGYSLGGALATYAALFDHTPAVVFNSPGIYKRTLKEWEVIPHKVRVEHYTTSSDPISKMGQLVGKVHCANLNPKLRPIEAHTGCIFW